MVLFTIPSSVSHANVWLCCDEVDSRRSIKLKSQLEEYFEAQPQVKDGQVTMVSFSRELDTDAISWIDKLVRYLHITQYIHGIRETLTESSPIYSTP